MTRLVALTGASGFIGGNLARGFIHRDWRVTGLTRRPPDDPHLASPVEWVQGDLEDPAALTRLVRDAEVVIHCAGAVRGSSWKAFDRVNALGTLRVVEAAREREDPRPPFLLVSSLAAREPQLSGYAASKRRGEELLARAAQGMAWTVFRPTAVYGPGDRELASLLRAARRGVLPVLGRADGRVTLLHVKDLVRAVLRWVEDPTAASGVYELHDGTPGGYSWREIARIAGESWDRPVRAIPAPGWLLFALAEANEKLARLLGYAPMLTPGKVRELRHPDWTCDNAPLTSALGWEPRLDLAAALRRGDALTGSR